jgi:hypothetical protein
MIETRFYNPSVSRTALKEAERDREVIQGYFAGLNESFAAFIGNQVLRRSFLPNRSEDDVMERDRLSALLGEKHAGLLSIRFIDDDGSRIHYSTLKEDLLEEGVSPAYRSYKTYPENMPRESPSASAKGEPRLILDRGGEYIVFFYPFYDALELYQGNAIFTLSSGSLTGALVDSGRLGIGESAVILEEPPGVILGLPRAGGDAAVRRAGEIWKQAGNYRGKGGLNRVDPGGGNAPLVLVSSQTDGGIFTGRIIGEKPFVFSPAMRAVLLLAFFLTSFLTIFLLFNVRADPMTVVQTQLRGIRTAILEECRNRKNSALPVRSWELEQRREDLHQEIKKILRIKPNGNGRNSTAAAQGKISRRLARRLRLEKEIDAYIDLVWNELEALADRMAAPHGVEPVWKREAAGKQEQDGKQKPMQKKTEGTPAGPHAAKPDVLEPVKIQTALLSRPLAFAPELNSRPEPLAAARQGGARRKEPAAGAAKQDRTAELEPVKIQTALLSRPLAFTPELNSRLEPLAAFRDSPEKTADEPVFKRKNGITYINKAYTAPDEEMTKTLELDEKFKDLVDSVINDSDR